MTHRGTIAAAGSATAAAVAVGAVLATLGGGAAAAGGTAQRLMPLTVYLVRGERVAPVRRTVPQTRAVLRAALATLLQGASSGERRAGYTSAIPSAVVLRGVSLAGGVATVDLSRRFAAGGGSLSMLLRVAQVVHTATQFPSVQRVAFRLDGRRVRAIGGEGVIVDPPVGRAAFEGQAPPILVEQPLPGETVHSPLLVRGTANVFEARLDLEAVSAGGRLLAHRALTATAGTGTRGRFQARIAVAAGRGPITLVAFTRSPKDGARTNVVRVPLSLTR